MNSKWQNAIGFHSQIKNERPLELTVADFDTFDSLDLVFQVVADDGGIGLITSRESVKPKAMPSVASKSNSSVPNFVQKSTRRLKILSTGGDRCNMRISDGMRWEHNGNMPRRHCIDYTASASQYHSRPLPGSSLSLGEMVQLDSSSQLIGCKG